jgi:hypothetical protein
MNGKRRSREGASPDFQAGKMTTTTFAGNQARRVRTPSASQCQPKRRRAQLAAETDSAGCSWHLVGGWAVEMMR